MISIGAIENIKVADVFDRYPKHIQEKLLFLRQLILDTASETDGVDTVEETLKWGEPSYIAKSGSTIRINWKESNLNQCAMYFNCNSKLVDTFRELYRDQFNFEGNRAIMFDANDEIPVDELKQCISLALTYHTRKHLPMLGI
ncbi:DUF1801 domain-containing protein [Paenibacillus sp. MZ04-78.2]|uniref:DUF1801 domain-containing protein n=1 Tax=Paenibacillus sp. MZ04-78.2 TaxID=2962034 RepID=UPI0020B6F5BA|nr:DUF1801 domain-containing protein [Paenibacillus sp. MZ04-78.2]MCP3773886.1 DUF1801 domain-containing protein [Paenibacillus sp. MZ04-78.2]